MDNAGKMNKKHWQGTVKSVVAKHNPGVCGIIRYLCCVGC